MNQANDFVIEGGMLLEYTGTDAHVVIPKGVTEIDSDVFEDCETVRRVTIPKGVESPRQLK